MATQANFKFEIKADLGHLANRLSQVHALLDSEAQQKKLMNDIATVLENSTRKRFETKTEPNGKAWEGWSDNTRQSPKYRQRNERERLLRDSSQLFKSLTRHATAQLAQVGSNKEYAPYLQLSTKNMPARPFFGISQTDHADISDEISKWLNRVWEAK